MSSVSADFFNSKSLWSIHSAASGSQWSSFIKGIFESIENRETKMFPYAQLNTDGSVSILFSENDMTSSFAEKISHEVIISQIDYYRNHLGIPTIAGKPLIEVIIHPQIELTEYRFNLTPDNLDSILKMNSKYTGYKGENSLLKLNKKIDLTDDLIRLFPVYPINDREFIIRAAGCQMTETISVQLLQLLPKDETDPVPRLHHVHQSVEKRLFLSSSRIMEIINKILESKKMTREYMYVQSDGLYLLSSPASDEQNDVGTVRISAMTPNSQTLYQMYGNCSKEELEQCHSLEITRSVFIKFALDEIKDEFQRAAFKEILDPQTDSLPH